MVLGIPVFYCRIKLSRHRHGLATAAVMGCVAVGSLVFLLYFVVQIFDEANYLRLVLTDPDPEMWPVRFFDSNSGHQLATTVPLTAVSCVVGFWARRWSVCSACRRSSSLPSSPTPLRTQSRRR